MLNFNTETKYPLEMYCSYHTTPLRDRRRRSRGVAGRGPPPSPPDAPLGPSREARRRGGGRVEAPRGVPAQRGLDEVEELARGARRRAGAGEDRGERPRRGRVVG